MPAQFRPRGVGINCLVALQREAWRNEMYVEVAGMLGCPVWGSKVTEFESAMPVDKGHKAQKVACPSPSARKAAQAHHRDILQWTCAKGTAGVSAVVQYEARGKAFFGIVRLGTRIFSCSWRCL